MSMSPGTIVQMFDQFGMPKYVGLYMAKLKPKDDPDYPASVIVKIKDSDQWHWQILVDDQVMVFNISFWTPVPIPD